MRLKFRALGYDECEVIIPDEFMPLNDVSVLVRFFGGCRYQFVQLYGDKNKRRALANILNTVLRTLKIPLKSLRVVYNQQKETFLYYEFYDGERKFILSLFKGFYYFLECNSDDLLDDFLMVKQYHFLCMNYGYHIKRWFPEIGVLKNDI